MTRRRWLRGALVGCLALFATARPAAAETVTVFAAASLKNALDEIAAAFEAETGHAARLVYAGSSTLARQIEQGAPADVFISANALWMDALARQGLIAPETRFNLAGNRLVLIAHGADAAPVDLTAPGALAARLGDNRLAMALVDAVPAGIYGKAALTSLGHWESVQGRIAQTDNVRAALALVATGEAPLGIVYATDAHATDAVTIVAEFPATTHAEILYPAAAVSGDAQALLTFLRSPQTSAILKRAGFTQPNTN